MGTVAQITKDCILQIRNFGGWGIALLIAAMPIFSDRTQSKIFDFIESHSGPIAASIIAAWVLGVVAWYWADHMTRDEMNSPDGWSLTIDGGSAVEYAYPGAPRGFRIDAIEIKNHSQTMKRDVSISCMVFDTRCGKYIVMPRIEEAKYPWPDQLISKKPLPMDLMLEPYGFERGHADFCLPTNADILPTTASIIVKDLASGKSKNVGIHRSYQAGPRKWFIGQIASPMAEINWKFRLIKWIKQTPLNALMRF